MFNQQTLPGFSDAISSPESQAGISHCPSQDGTDQSGQQAVPVSRSVQRGSKRGRKTNGTSGPSSSVSSMPSDLPSFSVSRFLQRSVTAGLMEYSQIWKERVTPAGRRYWEHTASGHRTSGSDCTGLAVGWNSPTASDNEGSGLRSDGRAKLPGQAKELCGSASATTRGSQTTILSRTSSAILETAAEIPLSGYPTPQAHDEREQGKGRPVVNGRVQTHNGDSVSVNLPLMVAGYSTPTVTDERRGSLPPRSTDTGISLTQQVAGYGTPRVSTNNGHGDSDRSHRARIEDQTAGYIGLAHGLISQSGDSVTENRGALDAAFSRWLMGFPEAWDKASPNYQAWCDVQAAIARDD